MEKGRLGAPFFMPVSQERYFATCFSLQFVERLAIDAQRRRRDALQAA